MSTVAFYAQFVGSKVGVNSLTVTWDIEQITRADGTRSALVTGGANSITVGRRGLYGYILTGADLTLYDYVATAITDSASVDQQEMPALWTRWTEDVNAAGVRTAVGMASANLDTQLTAIDAYLDAKISTIASHVAAAAPSFAAGADLAIVRYVDYSATISGLTISASWAKIYMTFKHTAEDAEADSVLQLVVSNPAASTTDGILLVSGAAASVAQRTQGSLTVDQSAGTVTLALTDNLTAVLEDDNYLTYDIKVLTATASAKPVASASCTVRKTETRTIA